MAILYEKIPPYYVHDYGIDEETNKETFKKGPSVILILSMTWFLSNVNGGMRLIANMVNKDIDYSYDPNRRIFGLGFGDYLLEYDCFSQMTPSDEELDAFVTKFFLPLVTNEGKRITLIDAMKNVRNINIVTYCAASKYYKKIENSFEKKMKELEYKDEEIDMILSQISLAAISGNTLNNDKPKASTMAFGDINDEYFESPDNINSFISNGDGTHDFTKYMSSDEDITKAINLFINEVLDNSISNYNSDTFTPLDIDIINKHIIEKLNNNKQLILHK